MKFAIVHHAEKKKHADNPTLTVFGHQQAQRAARFVAQRMKIQKIYCTDTLRTQQSAVPFRDLFPQSEIIQLEKAPQTWKEWCDFSESKHEPMVVLCHHTTIQMCAKQFQISLSRSSHSSVIILERTQENIWNVVDVRQGETSL